MPAFSRDLERTLSKAIAIAEEKSQPLAIPLLDIHSVGDLHSVGSAVCERDPADVAWAEIAAAVKLSREHQHPLHCIIESREV